MHSLLPPALPLALLAALGVLVLLFIVIVALDAVNDWRRARRLRREEARMLALAPRPSRQLDDPIQRAIHHRPLR